MRYGVFLAPFGDLSDPNLVADLAATAQDKGFDGVFVWALSRFGGPPTADHHAHEWERSGRRGHRPPGVSPAWPVISR